MLFDEKSKTYVTHESLRSLFWLRTIAIAAQCSALAVAVFYFHMALPLAAMGAAVAALALFNVYTRLRIDRPRAVAPLELLLQLVVDVAVLTILLACSGGATNPFAILYLLPLTIAAIVLPAKMTALLVALTIACYSLLLVAYIPLPMAHDHASAFSLHVFGMWLGFVLSAGVIAYFIIGLRDLLRRQAESLSKVKEEALRDEHLVKLGVLAASTAHDLGTPLNSMTLLLEDIECGDLGDRRALMHKTNLLREQILRCREALSTLSKSSGGYSLEGGRAIALADYIQECTTEWSHAHPATRMNLVSETEAGNPAILVDEALNYALMNIVDNAADASPDKIDINSRWDQAYWYLRIRDFGPGLAPEAKQAMARAGCSTKPHGLGLGLFLTHAIIERLGGSVDLYNHAGGGSCTQIKLPLQWVA